MAALETRIVAYRKVVADRIKELVPEIRDITPHAGAFGLEAVRRFTQITPAAKVVFLQMRATKRNNIGHLIGPATMAVYLITKDTIVNQGFGPALDLAEKLADAIELNDWGLPYCAAARVLDIEPIYSEDIDNEGIAVSAVTFTQEIAIGRDRHAEDEARSLLSGWSTPYELAGREVGDDDYSDLYP